MKLKKKYKQLIIFLLKKYFGEIGLQDFDKHNIKSIIILAPELYGDIILLTPLLKNLRTVCPSAEIIVAGVTDIIKILESDKNINRVYNIKKLSGNDKKTFFSQEFDLLYNTKDHPSTTFIYFSRRIKATHRVAINHPLHAGHYNHLISVKESIEKIRVNCMLLPYLVPGINLDRLRPYMPDGPISHNIENFIKLIQGKNIVGINLSVSRKYRQWKLANWIYVLEKINHPVVVIATKEDQKKKQILEKMIPNVLSSPATKTIFDAARLISHLKLLITPDTALIHIASCYNVPVIALYRWERDIKQFPPLSGKKKIILAAGKDINSIPADTVVSVFFELIDEIE